MNRKTNASRISILAAGAIGLAASGVAPAAAQQQPQLPQGWFKACSKQEDVDICNVQIIMVADSGQLLTCISLI